MTCYQVWVNKDNNFEFVFWWEYKNNNWVKIYDMSGNEVFSIDMPFGDAHFITNLPDAMYTVKTFHDDFEKPIQEFIIGKPPAPEIEYDIVKTDSIPPVFSESGNLLFDNYSFLSSVSAVRNPWLFVGDMADDRTSSSGWLSYDITPFAGARILNVSLEFNTSRQYGDPSTLGFLIAITIKYFDDGWGEHPISTVISHIIGRTVLRIFPESFGDGNFTVTSDDLESELLDVLLERDSRFQLAVSVYAISHNGIQDGFEYNKNDIHLNVTYQRSLTGSDYR
ncbi:MAG: secretory pathway Sec39 family protein, partial [Actinobacteria bacterium]|nr:secretory pathway Sec39 family protein [Actinomycetota bacterium]